MAQMVHVCRIYQKKITLYMNKISKENYTLTEKKCKLYMLWNQASATWWCLRNENSPIRLSLSLSTWRVAGFPISYISFHFRTSSLLSMCQETGGPEPL